MTSVFEIRVICRPDDAESVAQALANVFATGPARQYPTRDGKRTRLYFTADHRTSDTGSNQTESE